MKSFLSFLLIVVFSVCVTSLIYIFSLMLVSIIMAEPPKPKFYRINAYSEGKIVETAVVTSKVVNGDWRQVDADTGEEVSFEGTVTSREILDYKPGKR